MKRLLLLLSVFLTVSFEAGIDPSKDFRNLGSAKNLSGSTYVLIIFVSQEDGAEWTQEEVSGVYDRIFEAFSWIKEQDRRFGVKTDFSLFVLGDKRKISIDYFPSGPFDGDLSNGMIKTAMSAAGYTSDFDFLGYAKNKTGCDNCIVYVCCNSRGRSYALSQNRTLFHYNLKFGYNPVMLEGCVLFRDCMPAVIAHETLHLFGAVDLYDVYGDKKTNSKARRCFPNSVMHRVDGSFGCLEIDSLTAFLTGLTNKYQKHYEEFF